MRTILSDLAYGVAYSLLAFGVSASICMAIATTVHQTAPPDHGPCSVCDPLMARIEAARATVTPPRVTRPSAGVILVEGATWAATRPYSPPIRGERVDIGSLAVADAESEPIMFEVDPTRAYSVRATAPAGPDLGVPFDFDIPVPRIERIVGYFLLRGRLEELSAELAATQAQADAERAALDPITFAEIIEALAILAGREDASHERRNQIQGDPGDGQEHAPAGHEPVLDEGAIGGGP